MKRKIILIIFITSLFGIFSACGGTPAYAADETLTVSAAWADGDLLKIQVTDKSGVTSTLALKLSDYVTDLTASEYISVKAVDLAGSQSSVVQIKNPYYVSKPENADKTDEIPIITVEITPSENNQSVDESAIPDGKPFTPDGSGTVLDNVFDGDGKEFFSIKTDDGNIFYLIVDRQRNSDNVYLLNAVYEDDLMSLAQKKGRTINGENAIPTTTEATTTQPISVPAPESKGKTDGMNSGTIIFIVAAVIGVGGAGYYFKIYKNKKKIPDDDDIDDNYDGKMDDSEENGVIDYDNYMNEGGDGDE